MPQSQSGICANTTTDSNQIVPPTTGGKKINTTERLPTGVLLHLKFVKKQDILDEFFLRNKEKVRLQYRHKTLLGLLISIKSMGYSIIDAPSELIIQACQHANERFCRSTYFNTVRDLEKWGFLSRDTVQISRRRRKTQISILDEISRFQSHQNDKQPTEETAIDSKIEPEICNIPKSNKFKQVQNLDYQGIRPNKHFVDLRKVSYLYIQLLKLAKIRPKHLDEKSGRWIFDKPLAAPVVSLWKLLSRWADEGKFCYYDALVLREIAQFEARDRVPRELSECGISSDVDWLQLSQHWLDMSITVRERLIELDVLPRMMPMIKRLKNKGLHKMAEIPDCPKIEAEPLPARRPSRRRKSPEPAPVQIESSLTPEELKILENIRDGFCRKSERPKYEITPTSPSGEKKNQLSEKDLRILEEAARRARARSA